MSEAGIDVQIPEVRWDVDLCAPLDGANSGANISFDQKLYDVAHAALNHGMGVAYGSTPLPTHVHEQIEGAQHMLETAPPDKQFKGGARYWRVTNLRMGRVFGRDHRAFADQQATVISDAVGKRARRIKAVLNILDPNGEGEPHIDDYFTVVYARGSARIYTLDKEENELARGDIEGSGIAVFCGEATPKRVGFAVEAPLHRVDNPASLHGRNSLGVSYTFSPLVVSHALLVATEFLGKKK